MIAAGMLVGTLFTLFVVPTFYLLGTPQASAHPSSPPDLSSEFGELSSAPPT
jgi:hypothetical protein